jgi:hypothetical protein
MGVMGTLLQTVTKLIAQDRAVCYRSSTATNSGAHSMDTLKAFCSAVVWGAVAIGALVGYVALAMYTVGPR